MKKKVLFLQIKGKSYAGVWHVNKLVGEELLKNNFEVHIISIRNNQTNIILEHDPKLTVKTINENDIWETYDSALIKENLKKMHLIQALKILTTKIKHKIGLKKDVKKLHTYIHNYNPDYIISSHYQLLDMIPKKYLNKTIHEQHTSFQDTESHKRTMSTLNKYNGKVKFLWLTKKTMESAEISGLTNNAYIYNAVRFKSKKVSNVIKNKKLITIARLSRQKRIDIMIDIVQDIFKDQKYKDWRLEIYGTGDLYNELQSKITNHRQISLMGLTNNPEKELLSAAINLNTSSYEGFSLSILEANECGVPTVTLDFGESVEEEIINNKTGIIARDEHEYKNKLKELMDKPNKLEKLSQNAKEFSNNFQIENIVKDWIELFGDIDKNKGA